LAKTITKKIRQELGNLDKFGDELENHKHKGVLKENFLLFCLFDKIVHSDF